RLHGVLLSLPGRSVFPDIHLVLGGEMVRVHAPMVTAGLHDHLAIRDRPRRQQVRHANHPDGPPATKTQGCRLLVGRCARPSPAIIRILRLLNSIPVLGNLLFGKLVAHHVPPVERQHAYIPLYHDSHQCHHAYHPRWQHTRYGMDIMCNRAHVMSLCRTDHVWTSPMTPEQLAIAALFSALQGGWIAIVKYLMDEVTRLREKLDEANKASADLISVQNRMLKEHGMTPPDKGGQA